ncbi:MAG: hypothetical protein KDI14_20230 [Halioglobus sp.]|nr:hypothetical protein [Halioglobus sp.]
MNDEQYLLHCRQLLTDFAQTLCQRTDALPEDDSLRALAADFQRLAESGGSDLYGEAAPLIDRLFTTYPDFAPTFPRDLLWFFGGDCLHFMPDEEIALHQQLDEKRSQAASAGEIIDLQAARAKLLNLQ